MRRNSASFNNFISKVIQVGRSEGDDDICDVDYSRHTIKCDPPPRVREVRFLIVESKLERREETRVGSDDNNHNVPYFSPALTVGDHALGHHFLLLVSVSDEVIVVGVDLLYSLSQSVALLLGSFRVYLNRSYFR